MFQSHFLQDKTEKPGIRLWDLGSKQTLPVWASYNLQYFQCPSQVVKPVSRCQKRWLPGP